MAVEVLSATLPLGMSLLCIQRLLMRCYLLQDTFIRPPKPSIDGGGPHATANSESPCLEDSGVRSSCLHNCRWVSVCSQQLETGNVHCTTLRSGLCDVCCSISSALGSNPVSNRATTCTALGFCAMGFHNPLCPCLAAGIPCGSVQCNSRRQCAVVKVCCSAQDDSGEGLARCLMR